MSNKPPSNADGEKQIGNRRSNKPPFNAYGEKQIGNRRTALIRIGAAWPHEKGNGFTVQVEALPLNFEGRIVVLQADRDDQRSDADEREVF